MGNSNLLISAWQAQKKQVLEWLRGDALSGASAAVQTMFAVSLLSCVKKNFKSHLKYNLIALVISISLFGLLYAIINIFYHIIGMFAWKLTPPNLLNAFIWTFWIQVGLWGILLRYLFYRSTEECFYERMKLIDDDGISEVHSWPENYSLMVATWKSILRIFRYADGYQSFELIPHISLNISA